MQEVVISHSLLQPVTACYSRLQQAGHRQLLGTVQASTSRAERRGEARGPPRTLLTNRHKLFPPIRFKLVLDLDLINGYLRKQIITKH